MGVVVGVFGKTRKKKKKKKKIKVGQLESDVTHSHGPRGHFWVWWTFERGQHELAGTRLQVTMSGPPPGTESLVIIHTMPESLAVLISRDRLTRSP